MKMKKFILAVVFALGFSHAAFAFSFSLDGNLSEWGVTPGTYGSSHWAPSSGVYWTEEDYEPGSHPQGFLNPGYGDQTFDAEAMYAAYDDTNLYFAIVTGFPLTGSNGYAPAPIAFDFGRDGSYEFGINVTGSSSGSLFHPDSWTDGLANWGAGWLGHVSYPISMINAQLVFDPSAANLVYNNAFYGATGHYVIEGFMPIGAFGSSNWNRDFSMHWTMTCGNDAINLAVNTTPEPASMALLAIGLVSTVIARRKRKI